MDDVNARRAELDEVERKSLRTVMIEERMRYCTFVYMLQPVVKEECEVMYELGHLQEVMQNIGNVTKEPHTLPPASEELILDAKTSLYPDSPGGSNSQACSNSLGSRKSSVCSISSINSNSSGSPGHQFQRSLSQVRQFKVLEVFFFFLVLFDFVFGFYFWIFCYFVSIHRRYV